MPLAMRRGLLSGLLLGLGVLATVVLVSLVTLTAGTIAGSPFFVLGIGAFTVLIWYDILFHLRAMAQFPRTRHPSIHRVRPPI